MPTNEERREAAARLRDIGVKTWHTSWHELYAIKNACGCYTGQDKQDVELKDRLADLIEPEERTCAFTVYQTGDEHFPTCSACGYEADLKECIVYEEEITYEKRFCANCGAKVVE